MSDPEKQPEKAEPTIKDMTPANDPRPAEKPVAPIVANSNQKTVEEKPATEPAASVTPVVDVAPKKEPMVSIPVPPVTPAAEAPAANNDNGTVETSPAVAPVATTAPVGTTTEATPAATTEATPVATEDAPAKPSRAKGFLKGAFNFAVKAGIGAAVSATLKTAAVVGAGLAGAPVWATVLISGLAVGLGATLVHDAYERRALKKEGKELAPYFSKAHGKQLVSKKSLKTFGISTVAAVAGSMLFMGFHEGVIQGWWNHLTGHAPAVAPVVPAVAPVVAPVAPVEHVVAAPPVEHVAAPPVAPVVAPVHCATPVEQFSTLVNGHHVSAQVESALHRAASANPRVHAQGLKDLAYYAQNGFGGVPKDHTVALNLFKQAADAGNLQGKVDMVYLQHYGLDGIHADKAASVSTMKGLATHSHRASELVKAWAGAGKAVVPTEFNSATIVQGMPAPACGA